MAPFIAGGVGNVGAKTLTVFLTSVRVGAKGRGLNNKYKNLHVVDNKYVRPRALSRT